MRLGKALESGEQSRPPDHVAIPAGARQKVHMIVGQARPFLVNVALAGPDPIALTNLTGTYTLDPAHSRIGFVARHAMVTKVRGAFNEFEGTATLDGANPANSTPR